MSCNAKWEHQTIFCIISFRWRLSKKLHSILQVIVYHGNEVALTGSNKLNVFYTFIERHHYATCRHLGFQKMKLLMTNEVGLLIKDKAVLQIPPVYLCTDATATQNQRTAQDLQLFPCQFSRNLLYRNVHKQTFFARSDHEGTVTGQPSHALKKELVDRNNLNKPNEKIDKYG